MRSVRSLQDRDQRIRSRAKVTAEKNELLGIVQGQSIANLDLSNSSVFQYV
jgi:hypothetical protein